ncbi:hypothetical protein [Mesorhizobium sp.]|uniref:hypothetical protein n=1 Tax=Mesorhizobium sp. TaxID=1871066 RepID=UPI000FE7B7ED|nr:hypothetical protein [Mesorhizobium sp.]RWN24293.1 MAG: hypothetical protein EOR95_33540 [Mesorhizobium sp.]
MPAILTIPGIGTFQPTFDRINICSDVPKADLDQLLPVPQLQVCSHSFKIEKQRGKRGSRLVLVCLPDRKALELLREYEPVLGSYRVTIVEAAFDIDVASEKEALFVRDWLACHLGKINHERGYITFVDKQKTGKRLTDAELKKRGLFDHHTIYLEHHKSAHNLKIYIRNKKLAEKRFGSTITRLEWTSKRSRAVKAHFGGDQLSDLINADLEGYLRRFLVLEQVDYVDLGRLLAPKTLRKLTSTSRRQGVIPVVRLFRDREYRAKRVAHLAIKVLEHRERSQPKEVRSVAEEVWRSSPAQLKGRFRDAITKMQAKRRTRKLTMRRNKRRPLTMKKLEACFTKIPLRRNRVRLRKARPQRP